MSAGLSTRNALHAINEHCAPGTELCHDRRATDFFGYKRFADGEHIPAPAYCPSAHGLGTPGERRRDRAARLDRLFLRCFKVALALVILALVFLVGFNVDRPRPGIEREAAYRMKAARLAPGAAACELDPHEGCLVCLHQDLRGLVTVAHHC